MSLQDFRFGYKQSPVRTRPRYAVSATNVAIHPHDIELAQEVQVSTNYHRNKNENTEI